MMCKLEKESMRPEWYLQFVLKRNVLFSCCSIATRSVFWLSSSGPDEGPVVVARVSWVWGLEVNLPGVR